MLIRLIILGGKKHNILLSKSKMKCNCNRLRRLIGNFSIKLKFNALHFAIESKFIVVNLFEFRIKSHLLVSIYQSIFVQIVSNNRHSFRQCSQFYQFYQLAPNAQTERDLIILRKREFDMAVNEHISISSKPIKWLNLCTALEIARRTICDTDLHCSHLGLNVLHNLICSSQICEYVPV